MLSDVANSRWYKVLTSVAQQKWIRARLTVSFLAVILLFRPAIGASTSAAQPSECSQPSPIGCPIEVGQSVQSVMADPGTPHIWRLSLAEGGGVRVALTDLPSDYDLIVQSPGGAVIGDSRMEGIHDETVDVTWAEAGDYLLYVGADPARGTTSPLPYHLRIAGADDIPSLYGARTLPIARWGKGFVLDLAHSPDGRWLALGTSTGVYLRDAETLAGVREFNLAAGATGVAFAPDGALIAAGSSDWSVRIWGVRDGALVGRLRGHAAAVRGVAFSPDGSLLATASGDGTARLWRVADGTLLHTYLGHGDQVLSVAFSPDGGLLVTGSLDKTAVFGPCPKGRYCVALRGMRMGSRVACSHRTGSLSQLVRRMRRPDYGGSQTVGRSLCSRATS